MNDEGNRIVMMDSGKEGKNRDEDADADAEGKLPSKIPCLANNKAKHKC